jgi:sugar/nucleoside kinase (ribokinase family)
VTRPRLAIVGYASIDEIRGADRGPPVEAIGGGAIYAALSASRLGVDVALHVSVGSDFPGAWIDRLAALGLGLSAVRRVDAPTRRARLSYGSDEERRAGADRDAAWRRATEALRPPLPDTAGHDAVLLCPMPLDLVARSVRSLRGRTRLVADTSEIFAAAGPAALAAFDGVDLFAPSLDEAHRLTGEAEEEPAAAALAARFPLVVLKRGRRGLLRLQGQARLAHPIDAVAAIDPTGAGDATVGALAAALLTESDPRRQLEVAAEAGRLAVGAQGPAELGW